MVYLVGGPPKCGKTTLAKRFSKKSGIPWISGDILQHIVQDGLTPRELARQFPYSQVKKVTKGSIDTLYKLYSSREIIGMYRAAAKAIEKTVGSFVDGVIADGHDYILEGLHIEPEMAAGLIKRYGKSNIRAIFVVRTNENQFLRDVRKSTTNNDWILRGAKQAVTGSRIANMICSYGKDVEKKAKKLKLKVFRFDNGFSGRVAQAINYLSA